MAFDDGTSGTTLASVVTSTQEVGSPLWWVERLTAQLAVQQASYDRFDAYYRGEPPVPWLPDQARTTFHKMLRLTRANYMGLVCDSTAERLAVEGFLVGDSTTADETLWRIWQANNLDNDFDQALLEALICGSSFGMVAPNEDDPTTPLVWMEHPTQATVAYEPGSGRRKRVAGLKMWFDDWTGQRVATLYLPDALYKFQAAGNLPTASLRWEAREVPGEEWGAANPLGVVPLVEIPNNPRLLTGGVSEIADVTDIQDRICKTLADRLMTQDFGAFPQKWASGWPNQDADGNAQRPIDVGRDRMVTTDVVEAKFGQWDAAPLDPYSAAKREDVKDIASRTRTPAQYLLGELSNVNGETLKASESGLVSKVKQRQRSFGEAAEELMRLAASAAEGAPPVAAGLETKWRNPEYRTEAQLADALTKLYQAQLISRRQAREDYGYTSEQIAKMEAEDATDRLDPLTQALVSDLAAPASGG